MFNPDFYPTPAELIEQMINGQDLQGKTILEPEAGKGDIVDYLTQQGASVIACEINADLREILKSKCNVIGEDFLKLESHQISHIDAIYMNPPFSADEKHILHAWDIAPAGCRITAICNANTINNTFSTDRKRLKQLIEETGTHEEVENAFGNAERKTSVNVAIVRLQKPGASYSAEFEGFFMEEEPEQAEWQAAGLMSYNVIRDLVYRYISAVKIFDEQLATAQRLHEVTSGFFGAKLGMSITKDEAPITRNEYKKDLQKAGWHWVFNRMNMKKHATQGLKEDINAFVEKQTHIPFTMKNIYRMLEIVIGTQGQRMDKALLEVFDRVTRHYDENRYHVEGWKTNSHYMLNNRFIFPWMVDTYSWSWNKYTVSPASSTNFDIIEDLIKALCHLTGDNYDTQKTLREFLQDSKIEYGKWADWGYFRVRGYKKGTMHFEFKNEELWARFNQRIAQLKGYPLFEHAGKTKNYGAPKGEKPRPEQKTKRAAVLFEMEV